RFSRDWSSDVCSSDLPEPCALTKLSYTPRTGNRNVKYTGGPWQCQRAKAFYRRPAPGFRTGGGPTWLAPRRPVTGRPTAQAYAACCGRLRVRREKAVGAE